MGHAAYPGPPLRESNKQIENPRKPLPRKSVENTTSGGGLEKAHR